MLSEKNFAENIMIEKLLKAKHWHLFVLTFLIPIVVQFIIVGRILTKLSGYGVSDPSAVFDYMTYFPILMILYSGVLFSWYWAVGTGLQKKIKPNIQMKVNKFKIFFSIPIIYFLLFAIFISQVFAQMMEYNSTPDPSLIGIIALVIIPLHFFALFCMLYVIYFVSKTIKTIEMERNVKFSEFLGEFILIMFFPIGVWIIQPRINKMIDDYDIF